MRREPGTGTIEERTNRDGTKSYRARVILPDGRASSPWFPDPKQAEAFGLKLRESGHRGEIRAQTGLTLADWWDQHASALEALRKPRAKHYRRVWRQHVMHYPIAKLPLARIGEAECQAFVDALLRARVANGSRPIAPGTAQHAWTLFSATLTAAVKRRLISENPAKRIDIEWPDAEEGDLEYWEPDDIGRMLTSAAIPLADRLVMQFAIGTGLRAGELVWMPLADLERAVAGGDLLVRFGSKGRVPKGGKTRTIALLPLARDAAERWLAMLPKFAPENPHRLAFPTARGNARDSSAVLGGHSRRDGWRTKFDDHQEAAKVRRIVWHGLRHTCGAALASGWFGRTWALHEIRDLLGHSSVTTTERFYGHLAPSALRSAAAETALVPWLSREAESGRKSPKPLKIASNTILPPTASDFAWLAKAKNPAGLRALVDARIADGWRPTPDECAEIARAALTLEPVAQAAQAVLDAAPEHRARRVIALLELLPMAADTARKSSQS